MPRLLPTKSASSAVRSRTGLLVAVSASALLAACSSSNGPAALDGLLGPSAPQTASARQAGTPATQQSELDRALAYWGEEYKKKPHDLTVALSYARNLKAAGHKQQAFSVLQGAAILHGDSKELASEYGRLALEFDQVAIAEKLLAAAEDPLKPDWRLISARGTALAKQGKYAEAIPHYERALALAPKQPSLMSNLAMAHAAMGDAPRAEAILREAAASGDPQVKQNLALVVAMQGKHDESRTIASAVLPADAAASDANFFRAMVKAPAAAPQAATPAVATRPVRPAAHQARVIEAKAKQPAPAPSDALRPAGGPADVGGAASSWSTTVSRAR